MGETSDDTREPYNSSIESCAEPSRIRTIRASSPGNCAGIDHTPCHSGRTLFFRLLQLILITRPVTGVINWRGWLYRDFGGFAERAEREDHAGSVGGVCRRRGCGCFLSSYVIDDVVAIDAGGLGFMGDLSAQSRVRDVFITHSHIDHIATLPIFLETVFQSSDRCVTLHAGAATLESLRQDVFNDRIWPDFIAMSKREVPSSRSRFWSPAGSVEVTGLRLTPIAVDHVVPTLGFLVEAPGVTVAIPSDTGPTESFWRAVGEAADLKAVFLEASFPDAMSDLAVIPRHLTPTMFAAEVRKLSRQSPSSPCISSRGFMKQSSLSSAPRIS